MPPDAVIFDVDGTLLDASEGISNSVRHTIRELGLSEIADGKLASFVGPPIQESFLREYGMSPSEAQAAAEIFRRYYKGEELYKAAPYEGIYDVFDALRDRNIAIGVATYKRHDYAVDLLEHFGFSQYCVSVNGADNLNVMKKADIIAKTMTEMRLPHDARVAYVGDTVSDARSSAELGIDFVAVMFGFGFKTRDELARWPNVGCANSARELIPLLTGNGTAS
jgi:phosphoglycolate phosphatase